MPQNLKAIAYYTEKLRFNLIEDSIINAGKRWVLVAPPGSNESCLLLAKAVTDQQLRTIGNQTGGRYFFSYIPNDYREMKARGVHFSEEPRKEDYGWWWFLKIFTATNGICWNLTSRNKGRPPLVKSIANPFPGNENRLYSALGTRTRGRYLCNANQYRDVIDRMKSRLG